MGGAPCVAHRVPTPQYRVSHPIRNYPKKDAGRREVKKRLKNMRGVCVCYHTIRNKEREEKENNAAKQIATTPFMRVFN